MRSGKQLAWIMAACAALAAQAMPTAPCFGCCDQPCCCPAATAEQPCGCQLDAQQNQPLALSRSPLPQGIDDALASDVPAARLLIPQALGGSRGYEAISLAIPIRPARILFGVWRN